MKETLIADLIKDEPPQMVKEQEQPALAPVTEPPVMLPPTMYTPPQILPQTSSASERSSQVIERQPDENDFARSPQKSMEAFKPFD